MSPKMRCSRRSKAARLSAAVMSQMASDMATLTANTFKDSHDSFLETLEKHGIEYNCVAPPEGVPIASALSVEIVITGGWGALAVACIAWASVRKGRKINVTTKDKQTLWLQGYSADEATKILGAARQITAIDTKSASESDET